MAAGREAEASRMEESTLDNAKLIAQIEAFYEGRGDLSALLAEFRDALLLVPLSEPTTALFGTYGGLAWVYGFTSPAELERNALARGENARQESRHVTVRGAWILDEFLPALPQPCGVAVDVAGDRPMMLPPVSGVVPDSIAVDLDVQRAAVAGGEA